MTLNCIHIINHLSRSPSLVPVNPLRHSTFRMILLTGCIRHIHKQRKMIRGNEVIHKENMTTWHQRGSLNISKDIVNRAILHYACAMQRKYDVTRLLPAPSTDDLINLIVSQGTCMPVPPVHFFSVMLTCVYAWSQCLDVMFRASCLTLEINEF